MEEFLRKFNLEEILTLLKEEKFDLDTLINITPDVAAELIPKPLGLRMKLLNSIWKYKSEEVDLEKPGKLQNNEPQRNISEKRKLDDSLDTDGSSAAEASSSSSISKEKNFDVKEILRRTSKGKIVLRNYEIHKQLEKAHRDDVVEILVDYCIEQDYCIGECVNKVMQFYGNLIPKLFPTEDSLTYFIPPQTDGKQQKRAKGKLIERYRNMRRKFRKLGLHSQHISKSVAKKSKTSILLHEGESLSEEEFFEKQQWLRFNKEPWEQVEKLWNETSDKRISDIHLKEEATIHSTFLDWPILENTNGHILISIDFITMFGTSSKFYLKWNLNKESIKHLMMNRIKHKTWINLLKNIHPEGSKGEDAVLLYLLPLLLKPKKVALPSKKNTNWKPSKGDMQEAFMIHALIADDIPNIISRRQEKLGEMSLHMQPFVIIEGEDLLNAVHYYVVMNKVLYRFDSPLNAIENCFKAFHVFHLQYPMESESVWLFIQKFFFEITTEWDKTVSDVCELISDITSYNTDEISD